MALKCRVHSSKILTEGEQASLNEASASTLDPALLRTIRAVECIGTKIQNILTEKNKFPFPDADEDLLLRITVML